MHPEPFAPGTLFSRFFHASPMAMTIATPDDGCYLDVNDAFSRLLGYPRAELIGHPNVELRFMEPSSRQFASLNYLGHELPAERLCCLQAIDGARRDVIVSTQVQTWGGASYLITLIQDLTAHFRIQAALRSSEARFRLFFESMPLPVIVYDHETLCILDANTNATEHYGYTHAELLSMTMLDIRPLEARSRFLETLHSLPDDARSVGIWQHLKKDGTIIDVDVTSHGLELDGRRVWLTVLQDVTEQLAMQAALRNSEQRLRVIAEVTTDVIWDFDLITRTTTYTQGIHTIFGHELDQISAFDWWVSHIHPEERGTVMADFNRAIEETDVHWSAQYRFRRSDGQYAHVFDRAHILRDEEGRAVRMIGAMVDISRQVEIKEVERQATMEERRRLARDLHDAVTQSLYSLTLMAEAARRRAQLGDEKATQEYIVRLGELAQQSLKEMRLLVYKLQPAALEKGGLVGALQTRLDAVERRSGIRARLLTEGDYELPPEIQAQIYRAAEEALNNALKHAAASAIRVRIRSSANSVVLEVSDNGKGFDPLQAAASGGLGLISIRERLENLGGRFELDTAPGKGTTIRISLDTLDSNNGRTDSDTDLR